MKVLRIAALAVTTSALALTVAAPLAAWHPKGIIKKEVQNQTSGIALSDANTTATAVAAKPGDILNYVVTISNVGDANAKGENDMAHTIMTDVLPAGVELVSNPSQRVITENIGTVKPGDTVKKVYQVKVTSQKDGDVLENKACFVGNSTANDNPQAGCDVAVVKVNVPAPTPTPTPTPTPAPTTPAAPSTPAELPSTGPEAVIGSAIGLGAIAYGVNVYIRSKRDLAGAMLKK